MLLLAEDEDSLALAAWQACEALAATIPKEEQAGHTAALKEALAGAREKERRKRRPGALQLHGLLLPPKALGPFVPIYLQGVLQVSRRVTGRVPGSAGGGVAPRLEAARLWLSSVSGMLLRLLVASSKSGSSFSPPRCLCAWRQFTQLASRLHCSHGPEHMACHHITIAPCPEIRLLLASRRCCLQGSSPEVREAAAEGLGELVVLTSEEGLRPFVVAITGPLIRIIGDRFPPETKAAILATLGLLIRRAGPGLKPFVPQLQTTFLKCLNDPVSTAVLGVL